MFADEMEPEDGPLRRLIKAAAPIIVAVVVFGGLAFLFWTMANDHSTISHDMPALPVVALPPPPPPPPPPKEQPPQPEKVEMETPTTPQPKAPPQALTINGAAQAGGDSFGLTAGKGGGMMIGGGSEPGGDGDNGFAEAAYTRYLTAFIQQAVQEDDRVTRSVFQLDVQLWVDRNGKIARSVVVKGSGDGKLDQQVLAVLQAMPPLEEPPPANFKNYFAHRITIRGRRS